MVRFTDRLHMTIAVDWDINNKQNKANNEFAYALKRGFGIMMWLL